MDIHSATAMSVLKRGKNNLPAGLMVRKIAVEFIIHHQIYAPKWGIK
jgi:hypothetical protein